MTDERWPRVKALFQAAVERPIAERDAFLAAATGDDAALRGEVESLLMSDTSDASFLRGLPVVGEPGRTDHVGGPSMDRAPSRPVLTAGRRVGPYEIVAPIGAGAMGEVYRVRDTKLNRDVALKVLPDSFAGDPARLARFTREAQTLAALNHPNIAHLYGLEESSGIRALVMELVEGDDLSHRLARGAMRIDEALPIARQIADALEAAHEHGIIHRDLKPANIKVRADGTVKVLDFGLAKTIEPLPSSVATTVAHSSMITSPAVLTGAGMILGTAAYMSPEQARGQSLDRRTDIWAFGCVLYEMLTGRAPFAGDIISDTLAAILEREPDWTRLPLATPPSIRRLLGRCLYKDPKRRLRDIGDARVEIEDALTPSAQAPARSRVRWVPWLAAGSALAVAVIAFVVGRLAVGPSPTADVRVLRLTDWVGLEETPAISQDGRSVAFVAGAGNSRQIWRRLVAGGAPLQLTRDPGEHLSPRWSPDSNSVIYLTPAAETAESGTLWEVSALGGTPRRIASAIGGADISHDGMRLTFFRFEAGRVELVVAARDGSDVRPLAQLESGYYYLAPRWSPDDRVVAYYRTILLNADMFVVPAAGGKPRQLTQDSTVQDGLTWSPDGSRIIFSAARGATIRYLPTSNLWSVARDGGDWRQLTFGEASYADPDISRSGSIVANRWRAESDIWSIPVDGSPIANVARASRVTRQTSQVFAPSVAPDGHHVAYVSDGGGHANIWVQTLATGESRQITYDQESDIQVGLPLWSPAGDRIAYFTARRDLLNYWSIRPDGSNRQPLAPDAAWAVWSSDGRWLYFTEQQSKLLKKIAPASGKVVTVRNDPATRPALSPDGRTLYYVTERQVWSGESDYEVRAANPESGPGRLLARIPDRRMPRSYAWQPVLSPDGQWLLLALVDEPTTNLFGLSTTTGELRQLTDFQGRPTVIVRRASWAPDGRSVFAAIGERDADIVLIEGLRP